MKTGTRDKGLYATRYTLHPSKGFTLVELAIVLVIVGLLVGMGAGLIGPLTKRAKLQETREIVKTAKEAIIGYVANNKTLPVPADFTALGIKTTDAYNRPLFYDAITFADLCTNTGTYITVNDNSTGTLITKTDIAFVILSEGENLCNQTGTASPFNLYDTGVSTACSGGGPGGPGYDDIVEYQDINTLRQKICNSFRIVTDSLPSGTDAVTYSPTNLSATDGTPAYTWNVVGQAPGTNGCTGTNYPIAAVSTGLCLTTAGVISGTPVLDGSYSFTVQVCDNDDPNLPNDCPPTTNKDRVATKSLSITINPNKPRITTEFLSYANVGQTNPYSATISATGGDMLSPYTWTITCPAAITLNGIACSGNTITGTPATGSEGTHSITVTVTDGGGRTATKELSFTINPSGTGGGGGGGSAPACSVSASPDVILSGRTTTLSFSISNGPAYASFSPQNGACTTFSGSTGDSCTTGSLSSKTTYVLSVSNANGSASCSTVVFIGQNAYRVWNNTGSRYDFNVDGACVRINNGGEITSGARRLNSGETIYRYSTNNGTCGGGVQAQLTYNSAVYADSNNNGSVNFTGTDR